MHATFCRKRLTLCGMGLGSWAIAQNVQASDAPETGCVGAGVTSNHKGRRALSWFKAARIKAQKPRWFKPVTINPHAQSNSLTSPELPN